MGKEHADSIRQKIRQALSDKQLGDLINIQFTRDELDCVANKLVGEGQSQEQSQAK